jgi:hypothetical protein
VLLAMMSWGNRHFAPEGPSVMLIDSRTGERVDPIMVDPRTREQIKAPDYVLTPGPAAGDRIKLRYASREVTQDTTSKDTTSKPGRRKPAARRSAPSSS